MQSAFATLRQVWFWRLLIIGLTGIIGVCVFYIHPVKVNGDPEDLIIRSWGMALQFFGAVTVWIDLNNTAKKFGKRSLAIWELVKERIGTSRVISGSVNIKEDEDTCSIRVHVRPSIDPELTVEKRLTQLEYYVESIDSEWSIFNEFMNNQRLEINRGIVINQTPPQYFLHRTVSRSL